MGEITPSFGSGYFVFCGDVPDAVRAARRKLRTRDGARIPNVWIGRKVCVSAQQQGRSSILDRLGCRYFSSIKSAF
jgi:hypothetical protein